MCKDELHYICFDEAKIGQRATKYEGIRKSHGVAPTPSNRLLPSAFAAQSLHQPVLCHICTAASSTCTVQSSGGIMKGVVSCSFLDDTIDELIMYAFLLFLSDLSISVDIDVATTLVLRVSGSMHSVR